MKKFVYISMIISISMIFAGCDNSDDSVVKPNEPGLSASATMVKMLTNKSTSVVISNGTEPYSVTEQSDASIASTHLDGRVLDVNSTAIGTTTVKVKDSSIPPKTISITINVVPEYSTSTSGSLSFTSDRGNVSVSGIGSLGNNAPTSGAGVIALSEFDGTLIYGYIVHSTSNIEIVTIFLYGKTNLTSGKYDYPSSDKSVEIIYRPNVNPTDTLTMNRRYILATTATTTIETLSSAVIKGTFSGNGFYDDNGSYVTSQTIAVSNGTFNVPVLRIGKRQESGIEKLILSMFKQSKP